MGRRARSSLPRSTDARIERTSGLANGRAGLFPSPALGECCHRSLARRLVAVRRRAVLVIAVGQRRHPRGAFTGAAISESWVL